MNFDFQKGLNEEQYKVVSEAAGPCLVLAGAGSGKTRTITYRVAYLLETGTDPEKILLLTFTNKAAREMMSRVAELVGQKKAKGIWGGTFHHIANRLLRRHAALFGFNPNFTIMDQEDARDMVSVIIHSLELGNKKKIFPSGGVVGELISFGRNSLLPLDHVLEMKNPKFLEFSEIMEEIARLYSERKRVQNAMDFDDLLWYLGEFLKNPKGQKIIDQFEHVLVDEYQDTNTVQGEIVKLFASGAKNVLVVGDDAQSIYSFRAANINNILDFPEIFKSGGKKPARIFKLETNYRSTPQILDFANVIIKQNRRQHQKILKSVQNDYIKPVLYPLDDQRQEAAFVVKEIIDRERRGIPFEQQAVLFRSAFHSQQLEMELARRNIPYDYRGGLKFFERAHIKDVLAFLRVFANSKEEISWLRLLSMQPGIGSVTAGAIYKHVSSLDEVDKVINMGLPAVAGNRAINGWNQFQEIMRELVGLEDKTAESLILAVLNSPYQEIMEIKWPNARERAQDIEQLAAFARGAKDLPSFLAELALEEQLASERDRRAEAQREGKVVLSTVHQAKGLEWEVVYIINTAEGAFPNNRALKEDGGLEEERRLMYVAATRARRELILTYPLTSAFDAMRLNQPSSFFGSCLKDILERMPYGLRHGREEETVEIDKFGEKKFCQRKTFLPEIDEL